MNLKDLFEGAENGVLTYEQLKARMDEKNAKFVDLSEGGYVAKQKYTDDLSARDTRITALDEAVKTRDTDLATLKAQLESAGTDATKLTELTTQFSDLQKRYDKDTKALQKQMEEQAYKHAVNDFANAQKFSSQAAKRDFVNSMLSKNLQMENDTIIGATDFMSAYQKENSDAFVVETPASNPEPKPQFVGSTEGGASNKSGDGVMFDFGFTGIRAKS